MLILFINNLYVKKKKNEKNTDVSKIIICQYILEMILHGQ